MSLELVSSSIVVVAHQFNPSVVSQLWLVRNGLLTEEDFEEGCVFTDAIVNVRAREFNLLVTPDQLQFAPRVSADLQQELIRSKVGRIVEFLPHVPYHALGINFVWSLDPEPASVATVSRRLFFFQGRPIYRRFDVEDAHFGAYFSKNVMGCRLKLDVKPVMRTTVEPSSVRMSSAIHFAFNFHLDVIAEPNPPERIRQMLDQWNQAKDEANRIVDDLETDR